MSNINEESIEKVINNHFDTLEDKVDNISKEQVLKEIDNISNNDDEDIIEKKEDIKAYLNGKLKEFVSAENEEYKVVILYNTRILYIRKNDINHPVPRHFWLHMWDIFYKNIFGIDEEQYKKLTEKEKGIFECKIQLSTWINKQYYTFYAEFYRNKEYYIWYDEALNKNIKNRDDINEYIKQKLKNNKQLKGEDIFNITTTRMSYYDAMIQKGHIEGNRDPVEYFKENKGLLFEIEWMSPEDYLKEAYYITKPKRIDKTPPRLHPLSLMMTWDTRKSLIEKYKERTLEGSKMPMPVLDYNDMSQEGRHRAMVAFQLEVEEIPVLIVKPYEE